MRKKESAKAAQFQESVIRGMTRICQQHNGVNLSQGFPDFPAPALIKEAAKKAIDADINQYAITWGTRNLRLAIARKMAHFYGWDIDPETEMTVTCGATEGMIATLLAILDPGDEVIVFAPFYENYGPDAILADAIPRYVTLRGDDWHIDEDELTAAFNHKTRAIIINTPHNPTGKVFSREELQVIASLCQQWDVLAITDEIYEHILYDDA
ncbi:MAG: aminotransferase class I/II-fold pyridoxal phosphate-dependent enzyme, partial [Deltaproteobacteria bacterium]|nr:aminotransferase class I/II-fold pyridoxal phosphate-dependent enzyme [Candidatus Anaeroferrophillus wilburensis]MBN2890217.1 aminotransferase class I/II-fold pyridoxal phosphate-dependent enzyme [Deltaproteobacteria bacterium]